MAKKNNIGLGLAALAVGAGAVAAVTKGHKAEVKKEERKAAVKAAKKDYRNTELGRYDKNSKGIYYSNGNYEAFARPKKPAGVDEKNAYIVGSGLASLAAACFLVRTHITFCLHTYRPFIRSAYEIFYFCDEVLSNLV